jgi:hypothetical protein
MSENPYAAPVTTDVALAERRNFTGIPTTELNKLRNDSHSIRAVGALAILGLGIMMLFVATNMFGGVRPLGTAELLFFALIAGFQLVLVIGLLKRPNWGRVIGICAAALMLLGFPIGTLIGILLMVALVRGERLFGPDRLIHKELEAEWKYRRKNKVE